MGIESLPLELLEAILLGVKDEKTLLLAQRVCRQWVNCIRQSSAIQQALFFQPTNAGLERCQKPRQNPLLAAKFPYWFPSDNLKACAMAYGAGDMQDFLDSKTVYLRPTASWRRMLVQQPPIMGLQWIDLSLADRSNITTQRYSLPSEACGDGLRMNTLYDLVVRSAEKAEQYFYFRVAWSSYKTYSHQFKMPSTSNPDPCGRNDPQYKSVFRYAIQDTSLLLDTWHTERMPLNLMNTFGEDTWTWDLIRGLQSPMGDLDVDEVLRKRKVESVNRWRTMASELYAYTQERDSCSGYHLGSLDEDDADL
ncbi:hypothetical protein N7509_000547 [Penicillium cosmopolitanum]|uniref:F-box domain-containing protein n=1 Tax=Penicillium cosmopolitanum TaxID=1131564 RepID=A0A9W9WAG9_9EURO|nr:uncharacterized protein N7509_000547 [Penicillium cosmopolitanum]KAJ5413920.1 hypothetical protein N7509_000547 [Penicillium cosmopolitanum]